MLMPITTISGVSCIVDGAGIVLVLAPTVGAVLLLLPLMLVALAFGWELSKFVQLTNILSLLCFFLFISFYYIYIYGTKY